jgi:hypothetical protein
MRFVSEDHHVDGGWHDAAGSGQLPLGAVANADRLKVERHFLYADAGFMENPQGLKHL